MSRPTVIVMIGSQVRRFLNCNVHSACFCACLFCTIQAFAQTIVQGSFESPAGPINMNSYGPATSPTNFNTSYLTGQNYSTFGDAAAHVYLSSCQGTNLFYSYGNAPTFYGNEPAAATQGSQAFGFTYGVTTALQLSGNLVPNKCYTVSADVYISDASEGSITTNETNLEFGASVSNNAFGSSVYTTPTPISGTPEGSWHHLIFTFEVTASNISYITFRIPDSDPDYGYLMIDNVVLTKCSLLPIKLEAFMAENDNGQTRLSWVTATEINCRGFEIERSTNGSDWNQVGFVKTKSGNLTLRQDYVFYDNQSLTGLNYYRLKQMALDGGYEYSPVRRLMINLSRKHMICFINPLTETLHFNHVDWESLKAVVLMDDTGRQVYKGTTAQNDIDLHMMAAGVYFVKMLTMDGHVQVEKIVKH